MFVLFTSEKNEKPRQFSFTFSFSLMENSGKPQFKIKVDWNGDNMCNGLEGDVNHTHSMQYYITSDATFT